MPRLLELLGNEKRNNAATIRRRFEETTRNYEAHLSLLKVLGIVEQDVEGTTSVESRPRETLAPKEGQGANEGELARRLLSSQHEIGRHARTVIARTLRRDSTKKDERGRIYPTERNMLIEAGVLRVDHDNALYEVTEEWHAECLSAAFCRGQSPTTLERALERQAQIGLTAEHAVLEYERHQVRDEDRASVVHVAAENTSAGFDIASVRWIKERGQLETRLIEVKAVGTPCSTFVWSSHERDVAQSWSRQYFIYLVHIRKGQADTEGMVMIQDPFKEVRTDNGWVITEGDWAVQRDVIE